MCNPRSTREQQPIALFPLGQVVATTGALEVLDRYAINPAIGAMCHPVMQKKTCVQMKLADASYRVMP